MKQLALSILIAGLCSLFLAPAGMAQTPVTISRDSDPGIWPGNAEGAPSCPGIDSCCQPEPHWRIWGGFVYMTRETNNQPLLGVPGGAVSLDAAQINFDYRPGFEVAASRRLGGCWEIEGRYLQIDSWHATNVSVIPGTNSVLTNPPGGLGLTTPTFTQYDADLKSAELMLMRRIGDRFRLGAGFRWLQLNEDLAIQFNFPGGFQSGPFFSTRNDLYGFQLAADAVLWSRGRLGVEAVGKAGIYGVNARTSARAEIPLGAIAGTANASDSNDLAFCGELGLFATLRLTRNIAIRGGYQALWLNGVALAPEQVGNTGNLVIPGLQPSTVDSNGNLLSHGAVLGLEIRW